MGALAIKGPLISGCSWTEAVKECTAAVLRAPEGGDQGRGWPGFSGVFLTAEYV